MAAFVYAPGEIETIEQRYQSGESLDSLATHYQKSVASIRMKLVKRGTYVKQTKPQSAQQTNTPTKSKAPATKSEVLVSWQHALAAVGAAPW